MGPPSDVCDHRGHGPVNQLCAWRALTGIGDRDVVSPNADTLYSLAWLDLRRQPIVVHVPDTGGRFNVSRSSTPTRRTSATSATAPPACSRRATTRSRGPGSRLSGPGGHERDPVAPQPRLGRPADLHRQHRCRRLRAGARDPGRDDADAGEQVDWKQALRPPRRRGTRTRRSTRPRSRAPSPATTRSPSGTPSTPRCAGSRRPRRTSRCSTSSRRSGSRRGQEAEPQPRLGDATLAGLRDAVAAGKARVGEIVKERFAAGFAAHNGHLVEPIGNYGTDYDLRALVDQVGLGALPKNVAVYPIAQTDRPGRRSAARKRYVLHFNGPANPVLPQLPIPADAFWSVTMYDSSGFFVPNALDRWLINDRSDLHYNADGSLDIYIQPDAPSDPDQRKNWLPSPADAPFRMVTRLYAPPAEKIDGILDGTAWKSGTILAVRVGLHTGVPARAGSPRRSPVPNTPTLRTARGSGTRRWAGTRPSRPPPCRAGSRWRSWVRTTDREPGCAGSACRRGA